MPCKSGRWLVNYGLLQIYKENVKHRLDIVIFLLSSALFYSNNS